MINHHLSEVESLTVAAGMLTRDLISKKFVAHIKI